MHSLLAHLASGVYPVPRFERVGILQVDPDRTVHILHSLFSIPFDLYSTGRRLFAFWGELPLEGLSPVVELPVYAFSARRSVCAVPRAYHISHVNGVYPSVWQAMPCKRVG